MPYIALIILLLYVALLIIGGKPLIRKKWYKDLIMYAGLLTWSTFIAVGLVLDWPAAAVGTTVAIINMGVEPIRQMMEGMVGWGLD
ncbi:hypothetical protein SAMN05216378_3865 [Paenibacillus catalpae]|uniref:Uncharacterized protein n=1 Tax=Paenibacillus catalpae TaxID=1045775 RepID=A0A1I2CYV4_9BACL|nr:hypothetical protein [Paenibacillus catalpae]SFE72973.1 hypothetical protein SAMN05216378_3865 [Paenibacillus catalpae]